MPTRTANLDVWISGSVRADTSVLVAERRAVDTDLDVLIVTAPNHPQRVNARLDVAILVAPPMGNVWSTPVKSRYFERRPRWDRRIPITYTTSTSLDLLISTGGQKTANLDILVRGTFTRYTFLQVYIQLE